MEVPRAGAEARLAFPNRHCGGSAGKMPQVKEAVSSFHTAIRRYRCRDQPECVIFDAAKRNCTEPFSDSTPTACRTMAATRWCRALMTARATRRVERIWATHPRTRVFAFRASLSLVSATCRARIAAVDCCSVGATTVRSNNHTPPKGHGDFINNTSCCRIASHLNAIGMSCGAGIDQSGSYHSCSLRIAL